MNSDTVPTVAVFSRLDNPQPQFTRVLFRILFIVVRKLIPGLIIVTFHMESDR